MQDRSIDIIFVECLIYSAFMQNRDPDYLAQLRDYYATQRVLPSYSGVGKLIGLKSTSSVAALVGRLKVAGYLDSAPDRRLQPGKRFFEREVLDSVQAGLPQAANDVQPNTFNIDEHLIEAPSRTVLLRVRGDSMIDAGLMPGDTVIVKKGAPAKPGDIVVAIVDNEFTVKYLATDKDGFYLKPGNKAFPPIRARDHLEVFGLVVGSFRKYQ